MKCANCGRDAIYIYDPKPLASTVYCDRHLPSFLRPAAKAGVLQTTDSFDATKTAALAKLSVTPAPSPTPSDEAPPKPRRPRAKKAAAKPASEAADQS